jgi:hypothetical protein
MRSATQITVSTFGVMMALAGIEHGIGEVLQGNTAPSGIMFPSWPEAEFFRNVAGEPAMSIVPNLLITGILAVLFSLIYLVWATRFVQRKHAGLILILLAIIMLLVGGGIFPPIIGIFIGILATKIKTQPLEWRTLPAVGPQFFLSKVWPWSFVICVIGWLLLFPGTNILGYFFSVDNPNLTIILISFALGSLLLTIFSGLAHDSFRPVLSPQDPGDIPGHTQLPQLR